MAYTQTDLDALHTILLSVATAPQRVRFADGREVIYQTAEAVSAVIRTVEAQLTMQSRAASGLVRRRVPYYRSGL